MIPRSPTSPARTGNFQTIDAIRGLASLAVVFYHASLLMCKVHPGAEGISATTFASLASKGFLGVQVFFVVSGYCIANAAASALNKDRPLQLFAIARARRIFPPCWASLLFVAAAAFLATWLYQHGQIPETSLVQRDLAHQSWRFFVANLTLSQLVLHEGFLSDVCWTLCYEIAFYLIVALAMATVILCCRTNRAARTTHLLTLLHLVSFVCGVFMILAPERLIYPFDFWCQFGLGVALFGLLRAPRSAAACGFALANILLMSTFLLLPNMPPLGYSHEPSRLTYTAAYLAAIVLWATHPIDAPLARTFLGRCFRFLGQFSYSLYLVNFLMVSGLMILYRKAGLSPVFDIPAIFLIVAIVLPPSWLFYRLFEKPFLKTSSRKPAASGGVGKETYPIEASDQLHDDPQPSTLKP